MRPPVESLNVAVAAGVILYELKPSAYAEIAKEKKRRGPGGSSRASLHAKTYMVDRQRLFIGSLNLDPRSAQLNTEIGVVCESAPLASTLASGIEAALAKVARHTASVWARYAIDSQWSAGAGVFAQGQRQGDSGNTFQLPGYARVDAMVAYRFGLGASKASLQFNLDNVFNKLGIFEVNQASIPANGIGFARAINGRTISGSLRFDF